MATTIHIELPDEVHRAAKATAAQQGITLKQFVIQALEQAATPPKRGR